MHFERNTSLYLKVRCPLGLTTVQKETRRRQISNIVTTQNQMESTLAVKNLLGLGSQPLVCDAIR